MTTARAAAGIVGVRAHGIEEALLGRQVVAAAGSRLDLLRLRLLAAAPASGYIDSIGSSSRIASSNAP